MPPVLCFKIELFDWAGDFMERPKRVPKALNVKDCTDPMTFPFFDMIPTYEVFAIITFKGSKVSNARYAAVVKKGKNWIQFDFNKTSIVNLDDVLRLQLPHMVFYKQTEVRVA